MLVGLVGKPNVGKSTFYGAATLAPAEVANYPFTTIEANRGVAFARHDPCPHTDLGTPCTPRTGTCTDGVRMVPVEVMDVAGLVPGAHEGKGLGNKFLDDLRQADALIHVVDASGATNAEGEPVDAGTHDPREDVAFLEDEVTQWIAGIIRKGFDRAAKGAQLSGRKTEHLLAERLAGLGVTEPMAVKALAKADVPDQPTKWTDEHVVALAKQVRDASKPIIVAANKAEVADPARLEALQSVDGYHVIPVSAESELALRRANDAGLVSYVPGADAFTINEPEKLTSAQRKALERIQHEVLDKFGSTGVQQVLDAAVYDLLDRVVAFPVEDETHWTDKDGRILPDAFFLKKGATAKDLAFKVHTDLGEKFIRAINARSKRAVAADYEVQDGDVIRIVAGK